MNLRNKGKLGRARGIAAIWVILVMIITIGLFGASIVMYQFKVDKEKRQEKLLKLKDMYIAVHEDVVSTIPESVRPTGYMKTGDTALEDIKTATTTDLTQKRKPTLEGSLKKTAAEKPKDFYEGDNFNTLYELLMLSWREAVYQRYRFLGAKAHKEAEARRKDAIEGKGVKGMGGMLPGEINKALSGVTSKTDTQPTEEGTTSEAPVGVSEFGKSKKTLRDIIDEEMRKIRSKLEEIKGKAAANEAQWKQEKERIEQEAAKITGEIDTDTVRTIDKIRKLRSIIEDYLKSYEKVTYVPTVDVGHIVAPDFQQTMAYINLGSRQRIPNGLKLLIAKRGKSGLFDYKGECEVVTADTNVAKVRILKVYDKANAPIIDGDLVVNPLFNSVRPVKIAVLGESTKKNKLRSSIVEFGSELVDSVTPEVDFVIVLGKESAEGTDKELQKELDQAIKNGIPLWDEAEVLKFIWD